MRILSYVCFGLVLGLVSCSTSKVSIDQGLYDDFDLDSYKSFSFLPVDQSNSEVPAFSESVVYLKEEITKQMNARGLSENNSGADLNINLGIVIQNKNQTRETSLATDPFMYFGQRNYTWQSQEIVVNKYKEGTLTMHLVDPSSNKAVWIGVISEIIPNKQEKKQELIEKAVLQIFESIDQKN
jgi:hypothetical protein